jgi:hypothetical protein
MASISKARAGVLANSAGSKMASRTKAVMTRCLSMALPFQAACGAMVAESARKSGRSGARGGVIGKASSRAASSKSGHRLG